MKLSPSLRAAVKLCSADCNFHSEGAYVKYLIRRDILANVDHETVWLASMLPGADLDDLDNALRLISAAPLKKRQQLVDLLSERLKTMLSPRARRLAAFGVKPEGLSS